jgi:hypothetical protein
MSEPASESSAQHEPAGESPQHEPTSDPSARREPASESPQREPGATPPVHDLLLALAGRLDDDLLAWVRELAAVGEPDQAIELATAALAAERVVLPPTLRAALVAAAQAARTLLDVERALPPGALDQGTRHRFAADAATGDAVVAALTGLPARRLSGCTLHLTWRQTPAGGAPGPVPRAVVLVEADPDRSPDVLAYLLAAELERAGTPASVEVFTTGSRLPAYHVAALAAAREIVRGAVAPDAGAEPVVPTIEPEVAAATDVPAAADESESAPPEWSWPESAPLRVVPPPEAEAPPERVTEPAGVPSPRPARRPPDPPAVEHHPAEHHPAEHHPAEHDPLEHDPLSGPLRAPLMAPLLEPERPGPPAGAEPAPIEAGPTEAGPVERSQAASTTAELPDEWADDWRSGDWAMPPTGRADTPVDPPPSSPSPFPTENAGLPRGLPSRRAAVAGLPEPPRGKPTDRSLFDSPSRGGPAPAPGADRPVPSRAPEPPRPPADDPLFAPLREVPLFGGGPPPSGGRRRRAEPDELTPETAPAEPDPSGQLSGTERDLLTQLQAELAARQRQSRPYRRAGRSSGTGAVNGHPDGPTPPDLAG